MKNKLSDLRDHLFATLEALQDREQPLEVDRARAIAEVAQVLINSARIEVEFVKATGVVPQSALLQQDEAQPQRPKLVKVGG